MLHIQIVDPFISGHLEERMVSLGIRTKWYVSLDWLVSSTRLMSLDAISPYGSAHGSWSMMCRGARNMNG